MSETMEIKRKSLQVEGMIGASCEFRIQNALDKVQGIQKVSAHYPIQAVFLEYDPQRLRWKQLDYQLEKLGFRRIETTDTVTFQIPETACLTAMEKIRALFSAKPWIENIRILPGDCTIAVSFDSRAWTARDILNLVSGFEGFS